jgi:hypothetical protein
MKTIHHPQMEEDKLYAKYQEMARKDVECALAFCSPVLILFTEMLVCGSGGML